jgi:hypothetical protein
MDSAGSQFTRILVVAAFAEAQLIGLRKRRAASLVEA